MIVHQVKIGESQAVNNEGQRQRTIYVASGEADLKYRDLLVHCRHRWELYVNGYLDFSICDRSGLEPEQWQRLIAGKITEADGVMMLVSENTVKDEGALWEIDCAIAHQIPIVGVDIRKKYDGEIPKKLAGKMTRYGWEWFAQFINNL